MKGLFTLVFLLSLFQSISAFAPGFPYGSSKVRGVNLGGWLVLEPWVTPSLFDETGNPAIIDEWTFGQYQTKTVATNRLKKHWDTWITEADFIEIAAAGLNHVRIPIGYWAFDVNSTEPFITGQLPYLSKAVTWAKRHGLKVIVDLHGVPGSQNGLDNSGRKRPASIGPQWHKSTSNVKRSNAVIKRIATMFRDQVDVVPIIAPLNEPASFKDLSMLPVVRQFWHDSYGNIRYPWGTNRQSNTVSLIHDAFQPLSYWKGFQAYPANEGVAMDVHVYQMFSNEGNAMTEDEHIRATCDRARSLANFHLWVIVGEWTPSMNDCAKYLNGRGVGSRYEGTKAGFTRVGSCTGLTGKASGFSDEYKTFLGKMWESQVVAFETTTAGWIQWTWKAEIADEWTYQAGLANGWIPQNPSTRRYPGICG